MAFHTNILNNLAETLQFLKIGVHALGKNLSSVYELLLINVKTCITKYLDQLALIVRKRVNFALYHPLHTYLSKKLLITNPH